MRLGGKKWVVPLSTLVLTLSLGSAAFAATGVSATDTTDTSATTSTTSAQTEQRSDETPLTGDTAEKVKSAALAAVGSGATIQRVETDADGHAAYEAHVRKADGVTFAV